MGLILRLNASELKDTFKKKNRDYYSYEAYEWILDYYEQFDEDTELNVTAICSSFTEIKKSISDILEYLNEEEICKKFELEDIEDFNIEDIDMDILVEMLEESLNGYVYELTDTFLTAY